MKQCEAIRPHLSALVDGELEPLESIAIRRHLDRCPGCNAERDVLEKLKIQVHVAGTSTELPPGLELRLRAAIRDSAPQPRLAPAWRRVLAIAAVLLCAMMLTSNPFGSNGEPAVEAATADQTALTHDALARLVAVHAGEAQPAYLDGLVRSGALMAFEELPGELIERGDRWRLVQASYAVCSESEVGSSALAVFRRSRVVLPPLVAAALDTKGVFREVIRGVEVRVSVARDKLFVLLSGVRPPGPASSI